MRAVATILLALALCAVFLSLSACNTTRGVGQDIEAAGAGLKNSAEKTGAD